MKQGGVFPHGVPFRKLDTCFSSVGNAADSADKFSFVADGEPVLYESGLGVVEVVELEAFVGREGQGFHEKAPLVAEVILSVLQFLHFYRIFV